MATLQAGSFAKPAHRAGSLRSALPVGEGWEGGKLFIIEIHIPILNSHAPPDSRMRIISFHNKIINSKLIKRFLCNMQLRQRFGIP